MSSRNDNVRLRRAASAGVVLLLVLAAILSTGGGFRGNLLGFRISLRSPLRPLAAAALLIAGYVFRFGWSSLADDANALVRDGRKALGAVPQPGVTAVVITFVLTIAAYSDYVPYWDAKSYFDCIEGATRQSFNLLNFRCVGHPSIVYLLMLGVSQYLTPWHLSIAYGINALLGAASIYAFYALLRQLFPRRPSTEYTLVTALYAFTPLFLVHAVFLNVDYGMTAFFVLFVYFLIASRYGIASVCAVAMMFSKEIGVAAFAVAAAADVAAFVLRAPTSWEWRRAALQARTPLLTVPSALIVYLVVCRVVQPEPGPWLAPYLPIGIISERTDFFLNTNLADPGIQSFLSDIFVLNYQWIYSGIVVIACGVAVAARTESESPAIRGTALFLALVIAGLVYAVTRYRAYNNARYVLIVAPLMVVSFYHALLTIYPRSSVLRVVLAISVALIAISNFRTIDVVSKQVFGTFDFGSHALLDMPSFLHGPRLDSIVYNFESLQFHYLLSDMMHELRPKVNDVMFMGDTTYNFPPTVDALTYDLTLDPSHAIPLRILSRDDEVRPEKLGQHLLGEGDQFVYMALANADNHQLRLLREWYPLIGTKRYERSGYVLDVYLFRFVPHL